MPGLSTAQVRALREVSVKNSQGDGAMAPLGPEGVPYRNLLKAGFLARKPGEALYYITDEGKAALAKIQGPAPG